MNQTLITLDYRITMRSPYLIGERVRVKGTRRMVTVAGYTPYQILVRDCRGRMNGCVPSALEYVYRRNR